MLEIIKRFFPSSISLSTEAKVPHSNGNINQRTSTQEIYILVDYDNFEYNCRIDARKGLTFLADRIFSILTPYIGKNIRKLRFRLYGGWYHERSLTKKAQALITDYSVNFPMTKSIKLDDGSHQPLIFNIELAYSLGILPEKHLFNTFRQRSFPRNIICDSPSVLGCTKDDCPGNILRHFINTGTCPDSDCSLKLESFLSKSEQKLVDTMIVADSMFFSNFSRTPLCLVSSDDDFLPAILSLLANGYDVHHLQTKNRNVPPYYTEGLPGNYVEAHMRG